MTSRSTIPASARTRQARLVVLAILLVNVGWAVGLPLTLSQPPTPAAGALLAILATAFGIALALILWAAATPWWEQRVRVRLLVGVVAVAAALWPTLYAWAEPGEEPWAWVAGFTMGVGPLVLRWRTAAALGAVLSAAAAAGALAWGQSLPQNVLIAVGTAAAVIVMGQVLVWMLRLLVAAEGARDAEIGLAAAEERVRLARELHDVLGHRLSVIALKAEVVGDLVRRDPAKAEAEAELIRNLATGTLREVRQTVHGFGQLDLGEQLRGARLVLESAGIQTDITLQAGALSAGEQQLAAAVIREAVTNLLQHSDAEQVTIRLDGRSDRQVVVITNDGARVSAGSRGIGLSGLRERAEAAGARLQAGLAGDLFEVRLELAPR